MASPVRAIISPFRAIIVDRMTEGPTTIFWDLKPTFSEPGPYRFRVQHSYTGHPGADDWTDVGPAVVNTYYTLDTTKRAFSMSVPSHYRVIISTGNFLYVSGPVSALMWLDRHQWRVANEKLRRNRKALKLNVHRREGYLLLRRNYGPACTRCLDAASGVSTDPNCPECWGVGHQGGYFPALPYQFAQISPREITERVHSGVATEAEDFRKAVFLGYPLLRSYDLFVDAHSDERFSILTVRVTDSVGAVPIVQTAEVGYLSADSPLYRFPIPERQKPY